MNIKPPISGYSITLTSIFYWSRDVYTGKYFNDLVYYIMKQNIRKRLNLNTERESARHFERFQHFNLKVLTGLYNVNV